MGSNNVRVWGAVGIEANGEFVGGFSFVCVCSVSVVRSISTRGYVACGKTPQRNESRIECRAQGGGVREKGMEDAECTMRSLFARSLQSSLASLLLVLLGAAQKDDARRTNRTESVL
ncbi:type IV pilus assembly PilZ [Anopheles sinensis]|uniref:Type IV pilus assembly PilZ n=1 Tax=Anopheles sinensis TaxID=74873 RepID=A0A084WS55_ANOSI|nr:type IV pilus assembly PilZ [Anopheles sinensis]